MLLATANDGEQSRVVFTLKITSTGDFTFTLLDQLDHVSGNGENFDLITSGNGSIVAIDFSSLVVATDQDGDVVAAKASGFAVRVQDDIPVANASSGSFVSGSVQEDGMAGAATGDLSTGNKETGDTNANDEASGAAGTLTGLFTAGADQPVTIGLNPTRWRRLAALCRMARRWPTPWRATY